MIIIIGTTSKEVIIILLKLWKFKVNISAGLISISDYWN